MLGVALAAGALPGMPGFAAAQAATGERAAPSQQSRGPATVKALVSTDGLARGVVRARAEATLTARISSRITDLPYAEGTAFAKGARLVVFDCERPLAEARAAAAAVAAQRKQVETNEELDSFSAIGKNDLLISKAQLDKALAESDALMTQSKECAVVAPFAGKVVARLARQHEAVQAGTPLLKIVDVSGAELDLIVPSSWLAWLAPGTRFSFRVDETGAQLPGKVLRLLPSVDPVSRTIRIVAIFDTAAARVMPGMSGTASAWKPSK